MTFDLLREAELLLGQAGYSVRRLNDQILFEDYSLIGFVEAADTVGSIILNWKAKQDSFLRTQTSRLRRLGAKSWNVYSIFLSRQSCPDDQADAIHRVQENLEDTRKLVGAGVRDQQSLIRTLYPLLPIQSTIEQDVTDPVPKLRERLKGELPESVLNGLLRGGDSEALIGLLQDAKD